MRLSKLAFAAFFFASFASARAADLPFVQTSETAIPSAALDVLKKALAAKTVFLKEKTVENNEGLMASVANDSAAAALLNGYELQRLSDERKLGDVSAVADADKWRAYVLLPLLPYLTSGDAWVAAPLDIRPLSDLWLNAGALARMDADAPKTFDGLFTLFDRARLAGLTPLVVSGDPKALATLFEATLIASGGAELYKQVFLNLDELVIRSEPVRRSFADFARLRSYVQSDAGLSSRDAVGKVVKGEALAYFGPGETRFLFDAAGKSASKDYVCARFPSIGSAMIYRPDLIAILKSKPDVWPAQSALAEAVMDPKVQVDANLATGGVPARADVDLSKFTNCAKSDIDNLQTAQATSHLMPSTAYGFTQNAKATSAYLDLIGKYYRNEIKTPDEAVDALAAILTATR